MKTIKHILDFKGNDVFVTEPNTLVIDAVKMMAKKKVGALIVVSDNEIKGVFTEQDFTRRVLLKDLDINQTIVEDVMSKDVAKIEPLQNINDGMQLMTERHIRHLPVVEEDRLVGIISIGDLVKEVIAEQETIIEQLENYIHS